MLRSQILRGSKLSRNCQNIAKPRNFVPRKFLTLKYQREVALQIQLDYFLLVALLALDTDVVGELGNFGDLQEQFFHHWTHLLISSNLS